MKYAALFAATLAVFSPLFLIGIRKYTGRKAKRALGANIASFFGCLVLATVLGFGGSASAAGLAADTAAAAGIPRTAGLHVCHTRVSDQRHTRNKR